MARSWKCTSWSKRNTQKEPTGKSLNNIKTELKNSLVIGKQYRLNKKRMKLIGIYPNFATFEKNGMKESFSYQELYRILEEKI